jgi:hypothetical protein
MEVLQQELTMRCAKHANPTRAKHPTVGLAQHLLLNSANKLHSVHKRTFKIAMVATSAHLAVLGLMCRQQLHHVAMALVPQRLAQEVGTLRESFNTLAL